jgi:SAM-dependent methyltransferase
MGTIVNSEDILPTYTEQSWLQTPLGAYLLEQEQAMFDEAVSDLFGFNAIQLGMTEVDLLRNCRVPYRVKAGAAGDVALRCDSAQLPFATSGIDLLLLPHVLDFSRRPHDTLRDAERALVPEGHLVISGFNPYSWWGLRRLFNRDQSYPWSGRYLSLPKLKDWLALLNFEVIAGRMGCYAPPLRNPAWRQRFRFMDKAGDRWWPMLGGVYFIVAKKRVMGARLIRPSWNSRRMAQVLMPKPTPKNEYQKSEHGE